MSIINNIEEAEHALNEIMDAIVHEIECEKDHNYMLNHLIQKCVAQCENERLEAMLMIKAINT